MPKRQYILPPVVPGIQDKQLADTVKAAGFRKFTKQLMSQTRRPQMYGIALQPAAVEAICTKYGVEPPATQEAPTAPDAPGPRRKRENDGHRYTRIAGCRVSDAVITELNAYIQIDGTYKHVSELVQALLNDWLDERKQHLRRNLNI